MKLNINKNKIFIWIAIIVLILIVDIFTIIKLSNNKELNNNSSIPVVLPEDEKDDIPIEIPKDDDVDILDKNLEESDIPEGKEDNFQLPQPDNKAISIPILAYHNFMTKENKRIYASTDKYTMSLEDFEKQLNYLYNNGYHTISYNDLYRWLNGEIDLDNKSFMITIDDGNISAYHLAIPLIEKYNFSAIIFVIVGRLKEISNQYDPSKVSFFGDDIVSDIRQNHKNIILGSHSTYLHAAIDGKNPKDVLSYDELLNDLTNSRNALNAKVFAYPFGIYDDNYLNATKNSGFSMAFTFKPSNRVRRTDGVYEIPRININDEVSFDRFKYLLEQEW